MKIESFTNRLLPINEIISHEFNICRSFSIATAFIDESAIDSIDLILRKSKYLREAKLLVGVFGSFNRKTDLERLTEIGKIHAAKIEIHVSRNKNFHWKYYHFTSSRKQAIYVGSANFTDGGMGINAELLVKISDNISGENDGLRKLKEEFDREWNKSKSIFEFPINDYIENRSTHEGGSKFKGKVNDFFEANIKKENVEITSDKGVVVYLTDNETPITKKIILNLKPQWNSSEYFIQYSKRHFENCKSIKRILKIDRERRGEYYAYWVKFIDYLEHRTQDGNYFIAYEKISGRKKLSKSAVLELTNKNGLGWKLEGWKNLLDNKVLQKNQVKAAEEIIGLKLTNN